MIIENKICARCKKSKPVKEFYMRKGGDGFHSCCRKCEREKAKTRWSNLKNNAKKVQGKIPMIAGEGTIFAPDLGETLIGQTTREGWVIVAAKMVSRRLIWLTVEKIIDPNEAALVAIPITRKNN